MSYDCWSDPFQLHILNYPIFSLASPVYIKGLILHLPVLKDIKTPLLVWFRSVHWRLVLEDNTTLHLVSLSSKLSREAHVRCLLGWARKGVV